jgi:uncharacterized protein (TIGR02145 family)
VTNEGASSVTSKGVCWNTSPDPTTANNKTTESGGMGAFTSIITSLTPNTLYYLRAYAINSAGTGYGNQVSFTTSQVGTPVLTTSTITSISQTSAMSGGNITEDNGGSVTSRGVCWSISPNPTTLTIPDHNNYTVDGAGTGSFISSIVGLIPGTTYFIRAFAINSSGTGYGDEKSFTTLQPIISVSTLASPYSQTSATAGGNVTSTYSGATVTETGVYWSTNQNPTAADNKIVFGSGLGIFTTIISGLVTETTYYVRAYAIGSGGTSYGDEVSFTPYSRSFIQDIEGNYYNTITIGTQVWMKENLRVSKFSNGTEIYKVTNPNVWFTSFSIPSYVENSSYYYTFLSAYGCFYNSYAITDSLNICPVGWHVPSDADWTTLETYLGGSSIAGGKLKSTTGWYSPNTGATNESGFSALANTCDIVRGIGPGGPPPAEHSFNKSYYGYWWSSSGIFKQLQYNNPDILTYNNPIIPIYGSGVYSILHSVRCIKDN